MTAAARFAPEKRLAREVRGKAARLRDLMGPEVYDRNRDEIRSRGLHLDLPGWGYHAFDLDGIRRPEREGPRRPRPRGSQRQSAGSVRRGEVS